MKKTVSILLMTIFLVNSIGISFVLGYCPMMKSYSFSFMPEKQSCCCATPEGNKCCKQVKLVIKKIEDKYVASDFQIEKKQAIAVDFQQPVFISTVYSAAASGTINCDDDPPDRGVSLNILYRSILI